MRPGQQNKRGRGRGSNNGNGGSNFNRKGTNPLTRTYDSSGPDVKIRGTAQHIAEKYATLARDAQSAGDRVMAENYLQHAEHYNRIIAAAQAQMQERFQRDDRNDYSERDSEELDTADIVEQVVVPAPVPAPVPFDGSGPQPIIKGTSAEVSINEETPAEGSAASRERSQSRRRGVASRPRRQPRRNADVGGEGDTGTAAAREAEPASTLIAAETE